ncbi:unnamed protein product, partial [Durusdinium trenchii]
QYNVSAMVKRDSSDQDVEKAFRRVVKKVHPDKGGEVAHAQRLQDAREKMAPRSRAYMIRSPAVLLTYHGIAELDWRGFLAWVQLQVPAWGVIHWCASMERCGSGQPHVHLMLQFASASDSRGVDGFIFNSARPNACATDVCGEGLSKKHFQRSVDRGMFYVWADKIGTIFAPDNKPFTDGNYTPCWTDCAKTYQVLGKWPETLWKQRKITTEVYEKLLFLTRDGVLSRQRNLQACLDREEAIASRAAVEERVVRIRSNPQLYKPFPQVPEAQAWLKLFEHDALRYPILVVLGTMRQFKRGHHDGLVLDDVRDLQFLVNHQEKLQGKYDCLVEFGSTAGGTCAYHRDLFG